MASCLRNIKHKHTHTHKHTHIHTHTHTHTHTHMHAHTHITGPLGGEANGHRIEPAHVL